MAGMVVQGLFVAGGLPWLILTFSASFRFWRLTSTVKRLAGEQGRFNDPIFLYLAGGQFRRDVIAGKQHIVVEGDSNELRQAKRLLIEAIGPTRRRFVLGAALLLPCSLGAAMVGFFVCVWLGWTPMPGVH